MTMRFTCSAIAVFVCGMVGLASGCGQRSSPDPAGSAALAAAGERATSGVGSPSVLPPSRSTRSSLAGGEIADSTADDSSLDTELTEALFGDPTESSESAALPSPPVSSDRGGFPASGRAAIANRALQLRSDLPPERLTEFLRLADLEMQNIASGRAGLADQAAAEAEMRRIATLKLQAAEQLADVPEIAAAEQAAAMRGQLQALSHLAAMGDLASATRLEALARQQSSHSDVSVATDSLLVLIGLTLERLQNGVAGTEQEVVELVERLGAKNLTPDVSALMVMGQARAVLHRYSYSDEAATVRQVIVDLFSDHPNPTVAAMAIEAAGIPEIGRIETLLRQSEVIGDGEPTATQEDWERAITDLLSNSKDRSTIQYIAGAALQLESMGRPQWADAVYAALEKDWTFDGDVQGEVEIAVEARRARQSVLGEPLDWELPSVDGRPLSLSQFAGRLILMPFWAIEFPESLTVLQTLDELRAGSAGQIEIIGLNLDSADAPVTQFVEESPVAFRSFRSRQSVDPSASDHAAAAGSAADGVDQPDASGQAIARRFGVVSLPFVVIVGRDARVAGIGLTDEMIRREVQRLLSAP